MIDTNLIPSFAKKISGQKRWVYALSLGITKGQSMGIPRHFLVTVRGEHKRINAKGILLTYAPAP